MEKIRNKILDINKESREEIYPFNLLTNYNETIAAMAEVEGTLGWMHMDQKSKNEENTSRGALNALKNFEQVSEVEDNFVLYEIYGDGGVGRWKVTINGDVYFSEFHNPERAKKAAEVGFKIFK